MPRWRAATLAVSGQCLVWTACAGAAVPRAPAIGAATGCPDAPPAPPAPRGPDALCGIWRVESPDQEPLGFAAVDRDELSVTNPRGEWQTGAWAGSGPVTEQGFELEVRFAASGSEQLHVLTAPTRDERLRLVPEGTDAWLVLDRFAWSRWTRVSACPEDAARPLHSAHGWLLGVTATLPPTAVEEPATPEGSGQAPSAPAAGSGSGASP
jgi:hypothetical protein